MTHRASFVDYCQRYIAETLPQDVTWRSYVLTGNKDLAPSRMRKALARMGIAHSELSIALGELHAWISQYVGITPNELKQLLCEWYTWDRIRSGELVKCKTR